MLHARFRPCDNTIASIDICIVKEDNRSWGVRNYDPIFGNMAWRKPHYLPAKNILPVRTARWAKWCTTFTPKSTL